MVQVLTKAEHLGLLLKAPETGFAENFPQPPDRVHRSHPDSQEEAFPALLVLVTSMTGPYVPSLFCCVLFVCLLKTE